MPKSKREKVVALTKTQKQGRERKEGLIETIKSCFDEYTAVYVFEYGNLRTNYIKDIRMVWSSSRFFMGKNKLMQIAIGRDAAEEVRDGISPLAVRLTGQRGLLFTNSDEKDVVKYFANFEATDFAKAGTIAAEDVVLPAGPIAGFPPSMEPQLRKLGLPTELNNAVIMLREDTSLCIKGEEINIDSAKLLKQFDYKMAKFKLGLVCKWDGEGGYKSLLEDENGAGEADDT